METTNNKGNKMKATIIFDLDDTVINPVATKARYFENGDLDLIHYRANYTAKNVLKDKLLPLARIMKQAKKAGFKVVVLTARDDRLNYAKNMLNFHGLNYDLFLSRELTDGKTFLDDGDYKAFLIKENNLINGLMIDDNKIVKKALRKIGMVCLCAHKLNKRLKK